MVIASPEAVLVNVASKVRPVQDQRPRLSFLPQLVGKFSEMGRSDVVRMVDGDVVPHRWRFIESDDTTRQMSEALSKMRDFQCDAAMPRRSPLTGFGTGIVGFGVYCV